MISDTIKSEDDSENADTDKDMADNAEQEQSKPAAKGKRKLQARKGKTQPPIKTLASDSESDAGSVIINYNNVYV